MAYKQQQLDLEKSKIEDLLAQQRGQIESLPQTTRDYLSTRGRNVSDVLAQYDPSTIRAGQEIGMGVDRRRQRAIDTALGANRLANKRDYFTKMYNYAYNQYLNAGYDLKQAENFARTWAQQQSDQQFQTELQDIQNQFTLKKGEIDTKYENILGGYNFDAGDPYTNQLIAGLFNVGATGAAYAFSKNKSKQGFYPYQRESSYQTTDELNQKNRPMDYRIRQSMESSGGE